jgi:hypothetical protein
MLKRVQELMSKGAVEEDSAFTTPTKKKGFSSNDNTPTRKLVTEIIMRDIIDPTNNELVAVMLENTYCIREFIAGHNKFNVPMEDGNVLSFSVPATGNGTLGSDCFPMIELFCRQILCQEGHHLHDGPSGNWFHY